MRQKPWSKGEIGRVINTLTRGLKIRTESLVKVFSLIPKLVLFITCVSLFLYVVERLLGGSTLSDIASASVDRDVYQVLTLLLYALLGLLNKVLGALATTPAEVTTAGIGALIVILVLIVSVFSWRTAIYYAITAYVGSLVIGILLILASPMLGIGYTTSFGSKLSSSLASLFLFGFLGLLSLSRLILDTLIQWVGGQLADFLILAAAMSVLGLVAMYVDKRGAIEAAQLLRLPEIASDPRLSHQKKMEILEKVGAGGEIKVARIPEKDLVRYALLGGGLGVIAGALLFRHKIRDLGFLSWVAAATLASFYILFGGV